MKKWICPGISLVLAIALGAVLYRFMIAGDASPMADGRTAIHLSSGERDFVLGEMRGFLAGVQAITLALNENDMAAVAKAARGLGMATAQEVPASVMGKLPLEFKQMGMSVHRSFDQMAMDAESMGDAAMIQRQLGETLASCVACHATHRIDVASR